MSADQSDFEARYAYNKQLNNAIEGDESAVPSAALLRGSALLAARKYAMAELLEEPQATMELKVRVFHDMSHPQNYKGVVSMPRLSVMFEHALGQPVLSSYLA